MKRDQTAKRVAFCAVFSALSVALMWLSVLIPTLDLTLAAFAAIPVYIALLDFSPGAGVSVYLVAGILALLLIPEKSVAVFFLALFGWYPFLRNAVSKFNLWIGCLIKLFCGIIGVGIAYLVLSFVFPDPELLGHLTILVLILIPVVLLLYDYALGRLILFYISQIRPKLHR